MTKSEDRPTWCSIENNLNDEFIFKTGPSRPRLKLLSADFFGGSLSRTPYGLVHRINVEGCRIEVNI